MPKVSIIVPVYNTEKQLGKCLESLKNLKETEILIINDGSQDNSKRIIQEYQTKLENITYYEKENTGIADTRNFGMKHAKRRIYMVCRFG